MWYDQLCQAHPRQETVDPVSGELAYIGVNDLGGQYTTDEPYEYCRDYNNGRCRSYQRLMPDADDVEAWLAG
jgi:hypothetical protein